MSYTLTSASAQAPFLGAGTSRLFAGHGRDRLRWGETRVGP